MKDKLYIDYLIEFYTKQARGSIEPESRPLYFKKVVNGDDNLGFDDLVDTIEKLKSSMR